MLVLSATATPTTPTYPPSGILIGRGPKNAVPRRCYCGLPALACVQYIVWYCSSWVIFASYIKWSFCEWWNLSQVHWTSLNYGPLSGTLICPRFPSCPGCSYPRACPGPHHLSSWAVWQLERGAEFQKKCGLGLSASPFLRAGALTIGVFFEGTLLWGLTTSKEPMLNSNGFHIRRHRSAASLINLSVDSCLEVWYTPIVSIWLTGAHPIYSTAIQTSRILPWNFTLRHGGQEGRGSMGWRLFPDRKWPRSA